MELQKELKDCYDNYSKEVRKLQKKAGPADGLLGFPSSVSAHPCHNEFYKKVEDIVSEAVISVSAPILADAYTAPRGRAASAAPAPDTAGHGIAGPAAHTSAWAQAAHFILSAQTAYPDKEVHWMCVAAEKHALLLIPLLSKEEASDLLSLYNKICPPITRFPVQKEVGKALKKASRQ